MIVNGWPPNILEIRRAFPGLPRTAIFAYDHQIYVPSGTKILPQHLIVHERVHFGQQDAVGGAEAWWDRYLSDRQFRLQQEIEAYRAQWMVLRAMPRKERREMLAKITKDLSSSMYGGLVTKEEARRLITA